MKKILLITAALLASVVCFGQKFGVVSAQELAQLCPEADAARKELQATQTELQETLNDMIKEYQKKAEEYQANQKTWTPAKLESKAKELQDMQQRIEEDNNTFSQTIAQKQEQLFAPINKKVIDTIETLAKKHNLAAVYDVNSLLYSDKSQLVDLTAEARKAMNIKDGRTMESLYQELQAQAQAAQGGK